LQKTLRLKKLVQTSFFIVLACCLILSCTTADIYEKTVTIPGQKWQSSYQPGFEFQITDTTTSYKIYLVLRHTEKYNFNNIYVNLHVKGPGQDTSTTIQKDLILATNDKGWEGTAMDDIYEHRIPLAEKQTLKAGLYNFTIEQIMREDPLEHVLNVGLRLEREK
jgi:gliding motility-associated lipoprotein GldH